MFRIRIIIPLILTVLLGVTGCSKASKQEQERYELEFTVAEQRNLPEELQKIVEKHKHEEMRMSYTDGEDVYLIRGFGEQKTGGYSIAVKECSEDEHTIFLDTQLIGPQNTERLPEEPSCPYLAVKIRNQDEKEIVIQ